MQVKGIFKKQKQEQPDLLGDIVSIHKLVQDLEDTKSTAEQVIKEAETVTRETQNISDQKFKLIDDKVAEFEQTAVKLIEDINAIPHFKGKDGKSADPVDTKAIIQEVLSLIPEPKPVDIKSLKKDILSSLPDRKADLKIIQENIEIDPMSVIDKIMSLPEEKRKKLQLSTDNISGLQQTIHAFQSQLGRGYLHGGGLSTVSHDNTLTGTGTPNDPLHVVSSSSLTLQTNGIPNGSQTLLNLKQGTNITLTDDGLGGVTIDSTGGSGTPASPFNSIQFNDSGSFGGRSTFLFDGSETIIFGLEATSSIFQAPTAITPDTNGGGLHIATGNGLGNANGGNYLMFAGDSGEISGNGGDFSMAAGSSQLAGSGGAFSILAGDGNDAGNGGDLTLTAGTAHDIGNGGNINITAGSGLGAGSGGTITITSDMEIDLNAGSAFMAFSAVNAIQINSGAGQIAILHTDLISSDRDFYFSDQSGIIVATPDPNADTIYMWDDTDGLPVNATIGTNLSYDHSTHTLNATGGGGGSTTYIDSSFTTGTTYGTLAGTLDGMNTTFTVSQATYTTGKLIVYLNGQMQTQGTGVDWTETDPSTGTFDFAVAPLVSDIINVQYQ